MRRRLRGGIAGVRVVTTGMGPEAAARVAAVELGSGVRAVVVAGVAGGCEPSLPAGTVVVAASLRDLDGRPVEAPPPPPAVRDAVLAATPPAVAGAVATGLLVVDDAAARARLAATGVLAVETEAAAWASACLRGGAALAVVRAVLDTPSHPLGPADGLVMPGRKGPAPRRVARLAAQPAAWPVLLRLARRAAHAESRAAAGAVAAAAALLTLCAEQPAVNS